MTSLPSHLVHPQHRAPSCCFRTGLAPPSLLCGVGGVRRAGALGGRAVLKTRDETMRRDARAFRLVSACETGRLVCRWLLCVCERLLLCRVELCVTSAWRSGRRRRAQHLLSASLQFPASALLRPRPPSLALIPILLLPNPERAPLRKRLSLHAKATRLPPRSSKQSRQPLFLPLAAKQHHHQQQPSAL
jgi:hypothetical protein